MTKCIIGMGASSEGFKEGNINSFFRTTLANGTDLLIPILEVEAKNKKELKKKLNEAVDSFVDAL